MPDDLGAYDIDAVASSLASEGQMRAMLRTLLAERFHVIVRQETREVAGYAMRISSGFRGEEVPPRFPGPRSWAGRQAGTATYRELWGMDVGVANRALAALGLVLKPQRVSEDTIVVQHVEKPTAN